MAKPGVILPPQSRVALQRGVDSMANLLKKTLGPKARTVAIAPIVSTHNTPPEILNDGATIARRVIELPNPMENMGAMLIRQLTWKVREEVGDGSTTAAVLAQALLSEANRYVAAGGNVMRMKAGIESGMQIALAELDKQARVIDDPEEMGRLIAGVTADPELGEMFAEIYDIIGRDGVVTIQDGQTTRTTREYIEGVQWDKGYLSPHMVTDTDRMECVLEDALILLTNRNINTAKELLPILEQVREAGFKNLLIVANDVGGDALSLLVVNKMQGVLNTVAVKAPGYGERRMGILGDLAALTGGKLINEDAGDTVIDAKLEQLGRAQRVWADVNNFNVIGGYGDPAAVRERIANLRKEIPTIKDEYEREKARERLGKLAGGVCVISVGAHTQAAQKEKRNRIEGAVAALRAASEEGVVPGGGVALLACARAVRAAVAEGDEGVGLKVLAATLEAPARCIIANAGFEPNPVIAELAEKPAGWGFDVLKGEIVDMTAASILDPVKVVRTALIKGISGALMAMTTDALVVHKKPDWTAEP